MALMKTSSFIGLLGMLLSGACSSIERGVVVGKGHRVKPAATPPIDYYWVDVRGRNHDGERVTERLQLFKWDWDRFDEGDLISPQEFGPIEAAKRLGNSLETYTRAAGDSVRETILRPEPRPAKREIVKPRRKAPPVSPRKPGGKSSGPAAPHSASVETRYRDAEARVIEDPDVRDLKLKIHDAKSEAEQGAAFQEYRRTLYRKMRELDPSLKTRIDAAESAPGSR